MKIIYKYWEQDKGYEEKQAKIYNENNPGPQPVTSKQIIERYEREKIDPNTVKYAFSENDELLAYIQARDYSLINETHVGYPWASSNCPKEVQDKLFNEMVEYTKQRDQIKKYKVRMNASTSRQEIIDFFKAKNLELRSESYRYNLDIKEVSNSDFSNDEYTTRLATENDLNLLIDLVKADKRLSGAFSSDNDMKDYFTGKVLKDGHAILVFKKDQLVMASAPLIYKLPNDNERESVILRFRAYLDEHEAAFKVLLINIAKECVNTNYGIDKPLATFVAGTESIFISTVEEFKGEKTVSGLHFGLKGFE